MYHPFFAPLVNGNVQLPNAAINYGNSPLPIFPPGSDLYGMADGRFNETADLLSGMFEPYAGGPAGKPQRITTQTQLAFPNRVQLVIPKLYIPAPQADASVKFDPLLEHAISDGDLVFSFNMGPFMTAYGSQYTQAPYGYAAKAVQLINLATVNYILWGLQVGRTLPSGRRWVTFFSNLTHASSVLNGEITETVVWNFLQTYIYPFAIMHGSDMQGGQHEGNDSRVATHPVDYVSSFAIEGKLLHVNNLWHQHYVHENDDLILALRHLPPQAADLNFSLSSSVRSQRLERTPMQGKGMFYLRPEVQQYRSFSDCPYIHIGRSQKMVSSLSRGANVACWDARAGVIPGAPLQMTFEPIFYPSEDMFYEDLGSDSDDEGRAMVVDAAPVVEQPIAHVAASMGEMFAHALGLPPARSEAPAEAPAGEPDRPAKKRKPTVVVA